MESLNYSTMVDIYESLKYKDLLDNINFIENSVRTGYFDQNKTAKVLACCLALNNKDLLEYLSLMFQQEDISLVSVLKAVYILDTQRYLTHLESKKERLVKSNASIKKIERIDRLLKKNKNFDEGMGKTKGFKLNGAMCRRVVSYFINKISKDNLEKYAICMPNRQWQRLTDILHIRKEDFSLNWFLDWIYDEKKVPEDSIVYKSKNIDSEEKGLELIKTTDLEYKVVRFLFQKKNINFTDRMKNIVMIEPHTYLWYYEELNTPENDKKFLGELDTVDIGCGKLIERMTTIRKFGSLNLYESLKPKAERMLTSLKINIGRVAILGDASSSMEIAIETSAVIGCVISNLCSSDIRLFDVRDRILPTPKNVNDVVNLIRNYKTAGATAPAVSLEPYYLSKEKIDTFIVVTDEEENTTSKNYPFDPYIAFYKGDSFTDIFRKYVAEVNLCVNLVFISFTQNGIDGQMVRELKEKMPNYERLMVFKVDKFKPDLTKLDKIIHYIKDLK